MTKAVPGTYDAQIAKCEEHIARYTGKIAALANNPDAGPARDTLAKVLESERNLKAALEEKRDAAVARPSGLRRFERPVTWRWVAFMGVVFAASFLFAHARHH